MPVEEGVELRKLDEVRDKAILKDQKEGGEHVFDRSYKRRETSFDRQLESGMRLAEGGNLGDVLCRDVEHEVAFQGLKWMKDMGDGANRAIALKALRVEKENFGRCREKKLRVE